MTPSRQLTGLRFDPEVILLRDPGVLFDRNFVGALHAELIGEFGQGVADITLLQMGFLRGLHDAFDAVADAFSDPHGPKQEQGQRCTPPLAMLMRTAASDAPEAALSLRGHWPERLEASARLGSSARPEGVSCFLSAGYTSGWLSGTLDADILALESNCSACGAERCDFSAREASEWQSADNPAATELLAALPFDALRTFVRRRRETRRDAMQEVLADEPYRTETGSFDPDAAIVHIWGPVMVVPFIDSDEALRAVELIGHDPAARDVSVVVVDLSGAIVDEAYAALALEQIIDRIEAWGAEAIFASVSPLSEPPIADLERQPLFAHKDLAQAIATAFQVADAQRSPS